MPLTKLNDKQVKRSRQNKDNCKRTETVFTGKYLIVCFLQIKKKHYLSEVNLKLKKSLFFDTLGLNVYRLDIKSVSL